MPDKKLVETWRFEKLFPALLEAQSVNSRFMTAGWIIGFAMSQNGERLRKALCDVLPPMRGTIPSPRSLGTFLSKCSDTPFNGMVLRRYFSTQTRWRLLDENAPWHPGAVWGEK
jgi:hypothetical protein